MIHTLARLARHKGSKAFFHTQSDEGSVSFSYSQTRFAAAAIARELNARGYGEGKYVVCNMYNGPEFVFLILAAAYGGFTLAVLNPRLSEKERTLRKVELESATRQHDIEVLTEQKIKRLMMDVMGMDAMDIARRPDGGIPMDATALQIVAYAEAREENFDDAQGGIVMFTSGSSGTPKATLLTWEGIVGAARAANFALNKPRKGIWQLVLPLCHIGGFQVMVRSLINENPFILYTRYQPTRILNDALSFGVTHISVVDKILQDLIVADSDRIITQYVCILLGGAALNDKTIHAALRAKANVYASYGMTETSSMIACAPVTRGFDGGLHLLPGYEVRIMRPDEQGVGQLHVKGPGVFKGYLNARSAHTIDKFFVTGDRALMDRDDLLHVFERAEDLIISGGENIYPAEIRDVLLSIPGVKDAFVFGTADETWGYRPVAFVEADYSAATISRDHGEMGLDPADTGIRPATCPQEFARNIHEYLEPHMSHLHHPKHILVMDEFPRTGIGKVDRVELKRIYDRRIDIKSISLFRVKQPFVTPIKTAKGEVSERESFFVEVEDWAGRTGIAECVSFTTNWYLPETIEQDYEAVKGPIARVVMNERYLHPSEVSRSLATFPALSAYPMAKAAVEPAIWDLYGKIVGKPLLDLIGGLPSKPITGGAVVGIADVSDTMRAVDRVVEAGYKRVKIKIDPTSALEKVKAVREKYPDLMICLDANQSFTEEHLDTLYKLDALDITCIEEPLDPAYVPSQGRLPLLDRLSSLQNYLKTPICLDESVVTAADMEQAMERDNLRCYTVKIAKFGGIQPTLDFCAWAHERGVSVWMGGMFDTGVSKRMHAAFQTLPGIDLPGDISDSSCYFRADCALPPLMLHVGELTLNESGYEAGLGCVLDKEYLKRIETEVISVAK